MKKNLVAVVVLLLVMPAAVFAASPIKEGLWEISTNFDMPGVKQKLPATSIQHCYTKEEVNDHKKVVIGKNKNCTVTSQKLVGNKLTWAMKCTGQGAGNFSGETDFNPDSYQSVMKMESQGRTMLMKINGKRLGNCK